MIKYKMDNTANLIAKLNYRLQEFIVTGLKKQGIKGLVPSHGAIVLSLLKHQQLSMNELARKINKDPSTVTCLVKKLTNLGYTRIKKDERDKRVNFVSLTPEGKALEGVITSISATLYQKQYEGFDAQEIDNFRRLLEKMIVNFEEE